MARRPTKLGSYLMQTVIDAIRTGVPSALIELVALGATLRRRVDDVLAFHVPTPATALPKRSVSLGSAGPGLAGHDGCRSCRPSCDSRGNWPAAAVLFR